MFGRFKISTELSKTLNVCNVICTVLVVAIHFNTKHHMDLSSGLTFNFYFQEMLTNGIARVAVPFFALVSGFFFFKHYSLTISSYSHSLKKRLVSLGIPYLLGASVILITEALYGLVVNFNQLDAQFVYQAVVVKPLSVQYWFIRDLLFLAVLSPLIYALLVYCRGWVAAVVMLLWMFDIELLPTWGGRSIVTIEVGAFFVLGALLCNWPERLERILKECKLVWPLVIALLLLITRVAIDPMMANWYQNQYSMTSLLLQNAFIVTFLYWLLSASYRLKHVNIIQFLAKFTFFVYLYHLLPLSRVIVKASDYLVVDEYKFYLTFPLAVVASFAIAILLSKYSSRFYKVLTGGRA